MARPNEESVMNQIRMLADGQSFSRSQRIATVGNRRVDTKAALQTLRNSMNQAVGRLRKEEPGSNFCVESICAFTTDHSAVICTVAATRLFGKPDDDDEVDI